MSAAGARPDTDPGPARGRRDFLVMVDPVLDQVRPVSGRAFAEIAAPRARVLARNCAALFLDRDGEVRRLDRIEPLGPAPLAAVWSWLGRPVAVRCRLERAEVPLEDFRTMLVDAVAFTRARGGDGLGGWPLLRAPDGELRAALAKARSLAELHAAIPAPEGGRAMDRLP